MSTSCIITYVVRGRAAWYLEPVYRSSAVHNPHDNPREEEEEDQAVQAVVWLPALSVTPEVSEANASTWVPSAR
jgi:hypothetical protein